MESKVSGHWTDDRLIAHLYGVEPEDAHFENCVECKTRLARMEANRRALDRSAEEEVSFDFLAAQRRKIYARLTDHGHNWHGSVRRWAAAAATVLVMGGGLLVYEEMQQQSTVKNKVSDAQLAQEVSSMTQDSEPQPTAPLQALFEE
jgi:anti-sigma factor RsiW